MNGLLHDLRYSSSTLARRPGLTVMATVSLASGIAIVAATFGLLSVLFARPMGIGQPEQVVVMKLPMPNGESLAQMRSELMPLGEVAGFAPVVAKVVVAARAEEWLTELVTDTYFSVLQLQPAQGRLLDATDHGRLSETPSAVISYALWQSRFFGADVRGRTLQVGPATVAIAGVAPRGFRGLSPTLRADLWVLAPTFGRDKETSAFFTVLSRLRPGATVAQFQRAVEVLVRRPGFEASGPRERVFLGREADLRSGFSILIAVLTGVVGLVLVVACANVAGLLLAGMEERRREIAIRAALGAGRWRIIRRLLVEGALLSFAGSMLGLVLAVGLTSPVIAALGAERLGATALEVVFDGPVIVLVSALVTLETLIVSLVPAWFATRLSLTSYMYSGPTAARSGMSRVGVRDIYVAAQVAIAFLLLVAAGLVWKSADGQTRSLERLLRTDVVIATLNLSGDRLMASSISNLDLLASARALPGARAAALAELPLPHQGVPRVIRGRSTSTEAPAWHSTTAPINRVSAQYFQIVRLRLVSGTAFAQGAGDRAAHSVVMTTSLAKKLWPEGNPLGRQVRIDDTEETWEVAGIAEDPPGLRAAAAGICFLPLVDSERASPALLVETTSEGLPLAPAIQRLLQSQASSRAHNFDGSVTSLAAFVRGNDSRLLVLTWLTRFTLALALLASSLTLAGFYATVSHLFARRTTEIGIRVSLGARPWQVRWLVLRRALILAWAGILVGMPIASAEGHLVPAGLSGTSWTPPDTLLGAALVVSVIALLAAYAPARRASAVAPTIALRCE